ncbi:MAG TPA: YlxR family protein [Aeromicrobium sp.]|nr:YlxR family protein [Aeromicrobium sp.]
MTAEGRLSGPVRTCIGCRERAERKALVRIVARWDGSEQLTRVVPDLGEALPGRGAHLHPDARCLDQAKRRRAFGRALRVEGSLDLSPVDELAKTWPDAM